MPRMAGSSSGSQYAILSRSDSNPESDSDNPPNSPAVNTRVSKNVQVTSANMVSQDEMIFPDGMVTLFTTKGPSAAFLYDVAPRTTAGSVPRVHYRPLINYSEGPGMPGYLNFYLFNAERMSPPANSMPADFNDRSPAFPSHGSAYRMPAEPIPRNTASSGHGYEQHIRSHYMRAELMPRNTASPGHGYEQHIPSQRMPAELNASTTASSGHGYEQHIPSYRKPTEFTPGKSLSRRNFLSTLQDLDLVDQVSHEGSSSNGHVPKTGSPTREALPSEFDLKSLVLTDHAMRKSGSQPKIGTTAGIRNTVEVRETPQTNLPLEVYENLFQCLSREDIGNMRLVCRSFEQNVSARYFGTVVVPFTSTIYGSLASAKTETADRKGKGRASDSGHVAGQTPQQKIPDVFRSFGEHVRRFAITFEVDESELAQVPIKDNKHPIVTHWGEYQWPEPGYHLYQNRAKLEETAEETAVMVKAFGRLGKVRELALSLDGALGWLNGPDLSLRAHVLRGKEIVFPSSEYLTRPNVAAQRRLWNLIESTYREQGVLDDLKISAFNLFENEKMDEYLKSTFSPAFAATTKQLLTGPIMTPSLPSLMMTKTRGIVLIKRHDGSPASIENQFRPKCLTEPHAEWLLESRWAQQAFLNSYMIAVVNNPLVFTNVSSFTLWRFSSSHLPKLTEQAFWDGLPNLQMLDIRVVPCWRDVNASTFDTAKERPVEPSAAVDLFYQFLKSVVARKESIKTLVIGWVGGGEHAEGAGARNRHVLSAPLLLLKHILVEQESFKGMLELPHVTNLTIINCWLTSNTLCALVETNRLANLTLESFSISAHPGVHRSLHPYALAGAGLLAPQVPPAWIVAAAANPGLPPAPPAVLFPTLASYVRKGSWPDVLETLKLTLSPSSVSSVPSSSDNINRPLVLTLRSCGYVYISLFRDQDNDIRDFRPGQWPARGRAANNNNNNNNNDDDDDGNDDDPLDSILLHRLQHHLMTTEDQNMGTISPRFADGEEDRLCGLTWGCHVGWPIWREELGDEYEDEDGWGMWGEKSKVAAEYDGWPEGGTGRFSGVVRM